MTKKYSKILFILFFLCISGSLFAMDKQEAIADWEKHAQKRIWDSLVLGQDVELHDKYSLNALCSEKMIEKVREIRAKALRMLKIQDEFTRKNHIYYQINTQILEKYASIDINPLNEREKRLRNKVLYASLHFNVKQTGIENSSKSGNSPVILSFPIVYSGTSGNNFNPEKSHESNNNKEYREGKSKVNLNEYATDIDKTDHYRLFLYIWEDNPSYKSDKITGVLPWYSCRPAENRSKTVDLRQFPHKSLKSELKQKPKQNSNRKQESQESRVTANIFRYPSLIHSLEIKNSLNTEDDSLYNSILSLCDLSLYRRSPLSEILKNTSQIHISNMISDKNNPISYNIYPQYTRAFPVKIQNQTGDIS